MFMLIMQFFWKYIDDLMGKGLEFYIILELLFYVSASLIPLALPLAILLSSIMTFGNLAEHNELTALKSTGQSLYKIIKPYTFVVVCICIGTFYFSNYIIPVANLKWRALIYDIQETKMSKILVPGTYSTDIDGYAIKVEDGGNGTFKDVVIHDHTNPNISKTIKAKKATMYNSKDGGVLYLQLENGSAMEELAINQNENFESKERGRFYPSRRSTFNKAVYKINIQGFRLNRTDEDLFKNSYEMLNVFQINTVLDSIVKENKKTLSTFIEVLKNDTPILNKDLDTVQTTTTKEFNLNDLSSVEYTNAMENAISRIRRKKENLLNQKEFIRSLDRNMNLYKIEYHRKFALTFSILVLFFVGAPLGAIVRKGGFGAPVVIAALLFMIYFVLSEVGEGLVTSGATSPFVGMWLATFVLSPFAFLLMRSAANDSKVFDLEAWKKLFKVKKK
jgi:lipopolysaccharide export system permease protein